MSDYNKARDQPLYHPSLHRRRHRRTRRVFQDDMVEEVPFRRRAWPSGPQETLMYPTYLSRFEMKHRATDCGGHQRAHPLYLISTHQGEFIGIPAINRVAGTAAN